MNTFSKDNTSVKLAASVLVCHIESALERLQTQTGLVHYWGPNRQNEPVCIGPSWLQVPKATWKQFQVKLHSQDACVTPKETQA